ncbi:glycosyl transferase family 90-domain-containing protein [Mycena rebaudengoi]|nr:glycosyl transferase family 90-domain-containing protein [Mycena rebaudengoi]
MPTEADLPLLIQSNRLEEDRRSTWRRPTSSLLRQLSLRRKTLFALLAVFAVALWWLRVQVYGQSSKPLPPPLPHHEDAPQRSSEPPPERKYATLARILADQLLARQSKTLKQATARYTLKNNRPPPPGYDRFFEFAQQNGCLIDEYDKVHRDFAPFYEIAEHHPSFFPEMLDKAFEIADDSGLCLTKYTVKDHSATRGPNYTPFDWQSTMDKIAFMLPDMVAVFNYQDEPRVLFNTRRPDAYEFALKKGDTNPFKQGPRPTKEYYAAESPHQCLLPNSDRGFGNLTNDVNAFLLSSTSTQHTHDLYPILSPARLSSCFADIVIPSKFYYGGRYGFKDNVRWEDKKSMFTGVAVPQVAILHGQNYHSFPRVRLVDMSLRRPDLIDAGITRLHNCDPDPNNFVVCLEDEIKAEYNVETPSQPREEVYKYKTATPSLGVTSAYSGSGSLVFKSSTFSEFFDDWLIPYVHYIPVLPDLSDLEQKIEWAIANDEEARQIQANGQEYAKRILTDDQMDCYHASVFLEHARLQQRR